MNPLLSQNKPPRNPHLVFGHTKTPPNQLNGSEAFVWGLWQPDHSKTFANILYEECVFRKSWGGGSTIPSIEPFCDQYSFPVTNIFIGQRKEKKKKEEERKKFIVVLTVDSSRHIDHPTRFLKHTKFIQNSYKSNLHFVKGAKQSINLSFNNQQGNQQ